MIDQYDYDRTPQFFTIRSVNILKLQSEADCEIFAAECRFAIKRIEAQLKDPVFGDKSWRGAAEEAKAEIEHRLSILPIRFADIRQRKEKAEAAVARNGSVEPFKHRFFTVAKAELPADEFSRIEGLAKLS